MGRKIPSVSIYSLLRNITVNYVLEICPLSLKFQPKQEVKPQQRRQVATHAKCSFDMDTNRKPPTSKRIHNCT